MAVTALPQRLFGDDQDDGGSSDDGLDDDVS